MIKEAIQGGYLEKLDRITQWEEKEVLHHESVSQHSFKVAVYTKAILDDIFGSESDEKIAEFKYKTLSYAIAHDFDEAILLRDISHELKYNPFNGADIRLALDNYVDHVLKQDSFLKNMMECTNLNKKFVKLADWIALLTFCDRELSMIQVKNIQERRAYIFEKLNDFCTKDFLPLFEVKESMLYHYRDNAKRCIESIIYR